MKGLRKTAAVVGAGLVTAAVSVAAPGSAGADVAADPCMRGWSNTGPRSCETSHAEMLPVPTLGDGFCAGILRMTRATAFDGPLWEYSSAPGMVHGIEMNLAQGFAPLGEWGSTVLGCSQTAIIDWHNLDTGQSGTVHKFVPADNPSTTQQLVHAPTGAGRVQLTMRTDHPSIPMTTQIAVP